MIVGKDADESSEIEGGSEVSGESEQTDDDGMQQVRKAAAALAVGVGSFADPRDMQESELVHPPTVSASGLVTDHIHPPNPSFNALTGLYYIDPRAASTTDSSGYFLDGVSTLGL